MHILIATDGTLDAEYATPFVKNLAGPDGQATVVTVVEVNRALIGDLRALFGERAGASTDQDAEYVGVRTRDAAGVSPNWPGDDLMLKRYLDDQTVSRTSSLVESIGATGLDVAVIAREGEDAAGEIIGVIGEIGADALVVGSHGRGFFDGLLGSTGTKLARRAPCPVLVLRSE